MLFHNCFVPKRSERNESFYERMRLLTRMDADAWEMLILFLLMGDSQGMSMTQWQNLFDSIVPDAD